MINPGNSTLWLHCISKQGQKYAASASYFKDVLPTSQRQTFERILRNFLQLRGVGHLFEIVT